MLNKGEVIVIGMALGILAGVMHADKVMAREVPQHEVRAEFNAEAVLDLRYQEWRQNRIEMLAWLIMKENGQKEFDCMFATGATALNRERDGRWGTLEEICKSSEYAQHYNGEPNAECYAAAEWAVDHPDVFPSNMFYFKEGSYHTWATDWNEIDGTCFSTEGSAVWN